MKIWSELPSAQSREIAADAATALWVIAWGVAGWQLFALLSMFANAGRLVHDGGVNLRSAGANIGATMAALPVVGDQLGAVVVNSMTAAANPFVDFGTELETLIYALAGLISALVVAVPVLPWLSRYLPWRVGRIRRLRAAERIARSPSVSSNAVEGILAARAVYSLDYQTLLEFSPDPFGDFASGRHDRLARAELANVGLRLRR